jgi:hypothetical protein
VLAKERQFVPAGRRWRRLAWIFMAGMVGLHLVFFINLRGRIRKGYPDFTAYYTAATILRDGLGHQLYSESVQYEIQEKFTGQMSSRQGPLPYIHPPFEALIFLPLTLLPYRHAFVVWDLLNVGALFGVVLLLRRSVSTLRSVAPWELMLGCLAFFPVFACFLQGQDSILLLLLCALGFNALKKEADVLAGCWFALGTFKFQWMVPIVLLFLIWKRRPVVLGFVAACIPLGLVSAGLVGWQALLHYPAYALQVVKAPSLGGVPSELMPNLRGLALGWPAFFSGTSGSVAAVLGSLLLFLFAATRRGEAPQPQRLELQFSLAITVAGLIGWHTNAHDLSLLVLPLVLMTDYCWHTPARELGSRFAPLLPVLPVLLSPLWIVLWLAIGRVNLMAIPLLWWAWEIGRDMPGTGWSRLGV